MKALIFHEVFEARVKVIQLLRKCGFNAVDIIQLDSLPTVIQTGSRIKFDVMLLSIVRPNSAELRVDMLETIRQGANSDTKIVGLLPSVSGFNELPGIELANYLVQAEPLDVIHLESIVREYVLQGIEVRGDSIAQ